MIRFDLADNRPPFLIAEIGKNFIQTEEEQSTETYVNNAIALIDAAADAGADAVKFQTHHVADEQANITVVSPHFTASDRYRWVTRNTENTPVEYFWVPVVEHCKKRRITFFTTPMSRGAAVKMKSFDLPFWKVGSGDVSDHVLLRYLMETGKPIILSTGMISLEELAHTVEYMKGYGHAPVILYCISKYPAPPEYFNLASIEEFKRRYPECVIGFSDHSLGYDVALAAAKIGARVIEKHFSLSREFWGSDHKVSMVPEEFRAMADAIHSGAYQEVDPSPWYGAPSKELEGATNDFRSYFNKSLVAARPLKAGDVVSLDTVMALRPRMFLDGYPADALEDIVGHTLLEDVPEASPITKGMLSH